MSCFSRFIQSYPSSRRYLSASVSPLSLPLEGQAAFIPGPMVTEALRISALPNGIRVVSVDKGGPVASVGVVFGHGSRDEPFAGATQMLSKSMFLSTKKRFNPVRLIRDLQHTASNVSSTASRESLTYTAEGLRDDIPETFEILSDMLLNPVFHDWEVRDLKAMYAYTLEKENRPEMRIVEQFYQAAYNFKNIGQPLIPDVAALDMIDSDSLNCWRQKILSDPSKIVIAGVDFPHGELVKLVETQFGHMKKVDLVQNPFPYQAIPTNEEEVAAIGSPKVPSIPHDDFLRLLSSPREPAKYVGGDLRIPDSTYSQTQMIIGFGAPGINSPDYVPFACLSILLGGGGSFSTGGPGKGMYSRLYLDVLNVHHFVQSIECVASMFSDSSVLGIHGIADSSDGAHLAETIIGQYHKLRKGFTDAEVSRAKNQLKASLIMNVESRAILMEDISHQLLATGKYVSPAEQVKQIEALTSKDLNRVVKSMLATNPTYVCTGDVRNTPTFSEVEASLRK